MSSTIIRRFAFCISVVFILLTLFNDLNHFGRYSLLTKELCDVKSQGSFYLTEAKGMWGSRRKKKDKDKEDKRGPGSASSDTEMEALYEELISSKIYTFKSLLSYSHSYYL